MNKKDRDKKNQRQNYRNKTQANVYIWNLPRGGGTKTKEQNKCLKIEFKKTFLKIK